MTSQWTDDHITRGALGHFFVWDETGQLLGAYDTREEAVEALEAYDIALNGGVPHAV